MNKLTPDQARLAADNHALIFYTLRKFGFDDEYYGVAAIGLCKAAATYDPSRGSFATYAVACIGNEIHIELRKWHTVRRYAVVASLDEPLHGTERLTLSELIADPHDSTEDILFVQALRDANASARDTRMMAYRLAGYDQKQIAAVMGLTQPTVSRVLRRLWKKLQCSESTETAAQAAGSP